MRFQRSLLKIPDSAFEPWRMPDDQNGTRELSLSAGGVDLPIFLPIIVTLKAASAIFLQVVQ
jgi:hypothetical protein